MSPRRRYWLRLTLGSIVWGGFLGILLGAVLGVLYGALAGDVGLGLDGAVLGCLAGAVLGGLCGAALQWRRPRSDSSLAGPEAWVSVPPAGRQA
jgi:predicted lipid-binding transport protein (Tim44 family)